MPDRTFRQRMGSCVVAVAAAWGLASSTGAAEVPAATAEQGEFFEGKVRPVLAESCLKCHGAKKQSGGLRLDSRDGLIEGGENGPAVVPGDPQASLLIRAVRQTHPDVKMPPKGKLAPAAVEALAAWVKMGAPWPKGLPQVTAGAVEKPPAAHWAFQPVRPPAVPAVKDASWVRTPVDAFILARLERAGLTPSPEADRRTLIRRVTLDLTGLPPTAGEVEAFVHDTAPGAYERVVDRLLASPHYGERWGRHWLDVARYADTKGYVFTSERRFPYAYTFRDYVIRSLNEDKPYDRFVVEQIAADRLGPGGDPGARAALGFLTVGRRFLNVNEDIVDDRIDVVTRGLLGLTVTCARCHDHKFDPIPTDDYYSLFGVFNSSVEPADPPEIPSSAPEALARDFREKVGAKQAALDAFRAARLAAVNDDLRTRAPLYLRAALDLGFNPRNPKADDRARADKLATGRLRAVSARWKAKLDATRNTPDPVFAPWHAFAGLAEGEFSRKAEGVARSLPDDPKAANPVVAGSFRAKPPATMGDVAARYGELLAEAATKDKAPADPAWEALRALVAAEGGPLHVSADALPRALDRTERNTLNELVKAVDAVRASHPGSPPRAMVLVDRPQPVEPVVFLRGNPGRPGKAVPRRFLKVLSGPDRKPFTDGSGRLELAKAIASPANPLTARVMVNRVWLNHFGAGLVATPSDFGLRSDPPTHPELLDWLADDFVRNGWSLKALHRRVVLSAAYRQRSDRRPELLARDPENRLLGRFPRRRLEFEAVRDALLAASGGLDPAVGGRPVAITEAPFPGRRTVYGFIDRQNLDGLYRTFDFASPDASSPRRFVTTVPQQALFLMNSPFVIEQAKRLAARPEVREGPDEARVRRLYARLFGREPEHGEVAAGLAFVREQGRRGPSLPPVWSYGRGRVDAGSGALAEFVAFPHWTGTAWQPGPKLPDPGGSYLHWHAGGGHPGPDPEHAAVLRWRAPEDATVSVGGVLRHEGTQGNGVRGRLVSSRSGVLGTWEARDSAPTTEVGRVEVRAGETLDFVVDARGDASYDSFSWAPKLREAGGRGGSWDAKADFHGPVPAGLTPWEEYAQVLLLTNEFVFVD